MVFVPLSLMVGPRAGHPEDLAGKDWLPGSSPAMKETGSLRIIHVLRAPVGGLFRHVGDLARAQAEAGHEVGLMCDTAPALEPGHLLIGRCQLGIHPIPMARLPGPGDLATARRIATPPGSSPTSSTAMAPRAAFTPVLPADCSAGPPSTRLMAAACITARHRRRA